MKLIALTGMIVMALTTGKVWADASDQGCSSSGSNASGCTAEVPEMDESLSRWGLYLLAGAVLLAGEKFRSRQQ